MGYAAFGFLCANAACSDLPASPFTAWAWFRGLGWGSTSQRVHVPNNLALGIWVIVAIVLVLGKYMIIGYLDR